MRFIVLSLALALAACSSQKPAAPPSHASGVDRLANGHAIYTTGRDLAGHQIAASPPPLRVSCIQCHRADGSGGVHLPGGAVSADLRHDALTKAQKHPYTIALLERAISTGIDNEGSKLNPVMPHWKMSKTDLRDVATYVYERLK
jgi:mono/diheme cytochrome c family protein